MYVISAALYVFTVGFAIDVFDLDKNWILLIFAVSAAVMIIVGSQLAKKSSLEK
jgi:hypothetical protein